MHEASSFGHDTSGPLIKALTWSFRVCMQGSGPGTTILVGHCMVGAASSAANLCTRASNCSAHTLPLIGRHQFRRFAFPGATQMSPPLKKLAFVICATSRLVGHASTHVFISTITGHRGQHLNIYRCRASPVHALGPLFLALACT